MARKGVAVSQIILLVLGILVLAVVAYLLYTNFVTTSTTITAETCRAAATRACTGCSIAFQGPNCPISFLDITGKQCAGQGQLASGTTAISGTCTTVTSGGKSTVDCSGVTGTINCNAYTGSGGVTPATTPSTPPTTTTPPAIRECRAKEAATNSCPSGFDVFDPLASANSQCCNR